MLKNDLQIVSFYDKYSRWLDDENRFETLEEAVERSIQHARYIVGSKLTDAEYDELRQGMLKFEAFPSMRWFQMAGVEARKHPQSIFNCSYVQIDCIDAFVEALFLLGLGVGVGFSVERKNVQKLPTVAKTFDKGDYLVFVQDSLEGWAESFKIALTKLYEGYTVSLDVSAVRPAGSRLKTRGGIASGPQPFVSAVASIQDIFVAAAGRQLTSLEAHDVMCFVASAIVSGGVRRSAMISLFDKDDEEMLMSKSFAVINSNKQRYYANNSMVIDSVLEQKEVDEIVDTIFSNGNGEPGIFNRLAANKTSPARRKSAEFGTNPCVTGDTLIAVADGRNAVSIKQLANEGFDVPIYSYNTTEKKVEIKYGRAPRLTGVNSKILKITLDDESSLRVTENHRLYLKNGDLIEAKDLKPGQSLIPFNSYNSNNYRQISNIGKNGRSRRQYRAIMVDGNHKVVSIEDAGFEDVYNITVDDNHNYFIITSVGEDGFSSSGILSKNCGEVFLRNMQFCNLSIANVRSDDTLQSLLKKVRLATIWGTIQSCVDKYVGLRKEWSENQKEERLLGVDLNGLLDNEMFWPGSAVKEIVLAALKNHAKNINKLYAARFGINPAAAITCNKPAGNSSVFFDTASGIHPRFAKYYIRRIVLSTSSSLAQFLMSSGVSCEPTNGMSWVSATTAVFDFYVDASKSFVSEDMGLTNMLDHWLSVKQNWAEHNPSSTIYYSDNEFDKHKIKTFLGQNQLLVSGITFLEKHPNIWAQAPYQEITEEHYNVAMKTFPVIDWNEYIKFDQMYRETMGQEYACVGGSCEL